LEEEKKKEGEDDGAKKPLYGVLMKGGGLPCSDQHGKAPHLFHHQSTENGWDAVETEIGTTGRKGVGNVIADQGSSDIETPKRGVHLGELIQT